MQPTIRPFIPRHPDRRSDMKTKTLHAALLASAVLLSPGAAIAQYSGPGAAQVYRSVSEALRAAPDDARVELEGFIVRQVAKEKYIFSDGQSQIRIEIDAEDFPKARIDDKTRVRIRGEVERDFMESPEIDVDRVEVIG